MVWVSDVLELVEGCGMGGAPGGEDGLGGCGGSEGVVEVRACLGEVFCLERRFFRTEEVAAGKVDTTRAASDEMRAAGPTHISLQG